MIPECRYPIFRRDSSGFAPFRLHDPLGGHLDAGALEGEWKTALGAEVSAAAAWDPLPADLLLPGELRDYRNLRDPLERRAWLIGRAALRRLARRHGAADSAPEGIPGTVTLAYGSGLAIAAAGSRRLGLHFEPDRPMPPVFDSVFLEREERRYLAGLAAAGNHGAAGAARLRLWTLKNALRRSDPDGASRTLPDYRPGNPSLRRGRAEYRGASESRPRFRYISHRLGDWRLSLAVRLF